MYDTGAFLKLLNETLWYIIYTHKYYIYTCSSNPNVTRRFFVNKLYAGCPGDLGWMVIIDTGKPGPCPMDKLKPWPVFLYSKHPTVSSYGDLGKRLFTGQIFVFILTNIRSRISACCEIQCILIKYS